MRDSVDRERRSSRPFDEAQLKKWGSLMARGTIYEKGRTVQFVAVSESHLLKEGALMAVHDGQVVLSSDIPTKPAYDDAGNRIMTQAEALRSFARDNHIREPEAFILPPADKS